MILEQPKVSPSGRYSLKQTASALEISRPTVYRMIAAGKLKTKRRESDNKQIVTGTEIIRIWQQTW